MKTLVVTGLNGTIGKKLLPELPSDYRVWNFYHHTALRSRKLRRHEVCVDLTDHVRVHAVLDRIKPDIILHMAAQTHVDRCEDDRSNGRQGVVWKTNVTATAYLAQYARKNDVFFCLLSTECVFSGKKKRYHELDRRDPINWYGMTKYHAEQIVETLPRFAILRSVIAFHSETIGETLFGKFALALKSHSVVPVVDDRQISPTYTLDIVKAILTILKGEHIGFFHISSPDLMSPYVFATKVARSIGIDPTLKVIKVSASDLYGKRRAMRRLQHSALDCRRTEKILGIKARSVDTVLSSEKLNILEVVPYFYPAWAYGGPAKLVYDTCVLLRSNGHVMTVYTSDAFDAISRMPQAKRIIGEENLSIRYFRNLSNRLAYHVNGYFPTKLFFVVPFSLRQFDVIHLHDFYTLAHVWICFWARIYRIPYVISVHGCLESTRRIQKSAWKNFFISVCGKLMLTSAHTVIATSTNERDDYRRIGVLSSKITLLQHGVKIEEFQTQDSRENCRATFGLSPDQTILLFVGRMHPIKGLDLLLEAFSKIKLKSMSLIIAGSDEGIRAQLEQQSQDLGIGNRVRFMDPISGQEKARLFKASDAFIYPSRSEGFSVGILEAAAAGLPLLLSQGCHFPEVEKEKAGLISPITVEGITVMIRSFSQLNRAERESMSLRAADLCKKKYSSLSVLKKLEKIYYHMSDSGY